MISSGSAGFRDAMFIMSLYYDVELGVDVAQLVEQLSQDPRVSGLIPKSSWPHVKMLLH